MSMIPDRRWFQPIPRNLYVVVVVVLLGIVVAQHLSNSRLKADVSRFQAGQNALLRERVDLKSTAEAWEKEAVEWRVKNGEPEPSRLPPMTTDSDRESIQPPNDPRP